MKKPKITVLMPVYNGEKYLKEAIDSILCQTLPDFEFLIIDDGSIDETNAIISSYADKRIRLIRNKENIGIAKTLERGIGLSLGKYIARLDSDDVSFPERLELQFYHMEKHQQTAVCGGWAKAISANGNYLYTMKTLPSILLKYNYWRPSPVISSSSIFRSEWAKNIKFNEKYIVAEDYDFWLKMSKFGKIDNLKKVLVSYRMHANGISQQKKDIMWKLSYDSFVNNFQIKNITLGEFLVISGINTSVNPIGRLKIIFTIMDKIKYPFWFMILDSIVYTYRWILNIIK